MKPSTLALLFIVLFASSCKRDELLCTEVVHHNLKYNTSPVVYNLRDIKKSYFLNNLWRLTYYKERYYNINKEKKQFYIISFDSVGEDTVDINLEMTGKLPFTPVDFSIKNDTVFFLSANETGSLYKIALPSSVSEATVVDMGSDLVLVADSVSVPVNTRMNIIGNNHLLAKIGFQNVDISEQRYFSVYSLNERKSLFEFAECFSQVPENYYPAMDFPFRLDIDSVSIVSFGNKSNFYVYSNLNGELIGEYCAYSKHCEPVTGMDIYSNPDIQLSINYMVEKAYYLGIVYDPLTRNYLRIAKHNQHLHKEKSRRINKREDAAWSLLVLDDKFVCKGEVEFGSGEFNFTKYFTNSSGVYFLSLDSLSADLNSSVLTFNKLNLQ